MRLLKPDTIIEEVPRPAPAPQSAAQDGARAEEELGALPLSIHLPLCLFSLGAYPYIWLLRRARPLAAMTSSSSAAARAFRRCALLGIALQLLLAAALILFALGAAAGASLLKAYALLAALLLLPVRTFCLDDIRWSIRAREREWDERGTMTPRTLPSVLLTHVFGSLYIQRGINRLIGLGMPGLAQEIGSERGLAEMLRAYLLRGGDGE